MGWGCEKHQMDEGSAAWNELKQRLASKVNSANSRAVEACPACMLELVRMIPEPGKSSAIELAELQTELDIIGIKDGQAIERLGLMEDVFADASELTLKRDKLTLAELTRLLDKLAASIKRARGEI